MYILCLSKGLGVIQQVLDEGVLPGKTLGFVPTAGDTYQNPYFVEDSRKRLRKLGIKLVEMDIAKENVEQLQNKLAQLDGLYVAGGNSFFVMYQLRQKQLYQPIVDRVRAGMPYFGESAGAVILANSIEAVKTLDNPEDAPHLQTYHGLGLIDFFPLPHVDNKKYETVFEAFMRTHQDKLQIVRYRDDQAILTRDGHTYQILASEIATAIS